MIDLERIVPLHPEGTAPPLFCVHASSGSAYSYLRLAQLLGADQPVYGIEAPGFDGDREPVRSLPALSAEYAETIRAFRPGEQVALLGWSFGGVIALDLARRLVADGVPVRQVILVDVSVPWIADLPPEVQIVRRFMHEMLATVGAPATQLDEVLASLPEQAAVDEVFAAVDASGRLPEELDVDLLSERYAVFRAHTEASYGFEVTEPYDGRVVHLIASDTLPEYVRWEKVVSNLTERVVPGSHHSIWTGDSLPLLAELVRNALGAAAH